MTALSSDAIGSVDSTGQMGEVLGLSEHLRDALWRVDSARAASVGAIEAAWTRVAMARASAVPSATLRCVTARLRPAGTARCLRAI